MKLFIGVIFLWMLITVLSYGIFHDWVSAAIWSLTVPLVFWFAMLGNNSTQK